MTDETQTTPDAPTTSAPPKRKGRMAAGRPRPRKVAAAAKPESSKWSKPRAMSPERFAQFKAGTAWKSKYGSTPPEWDGVFHSPHENRFAIDQQVVDDLMREGVVLQWFVTSVMGKPEPHAIAAAERNGWKRVEEGDLPGVGMVEGDGLQLMARPVAIHKQAMAQEHRLAVEQIETKQESFMGGRSMRASGADHPSAIRSNKINRTLERLDVPDGPSGRTRDGGGRFR